MRLELREVEVRPAPLRAVARVPRHVQAEVEERRRDRLAVDLRSAARRGASRAAGSAASRSRRSGGTSCPASRARSRGARRRVTFRWPSTTFSHVGEHASSKSAMKTRAPELSALIIILRSTGPVISQRRSRRSAGASATRHSASRTSFVSGRKRGSLARVELAAAARCRRSSSSRRRGLSSRWSRATNVEPLARKDFLVGGARICTSASVLTPVPW